MFYSKSTGGFYDAAINGDNIPTDAVEITAEEHADLLTAQSSGKMIAHNVEGYPVAIDPPQAVRTQASLLEDVAAKRWLVETGGVIVGGVPIKTDRESQAQLFSAYISLASGLIESTPWKAADGSFSLVTMAELEPVAQAIAAHVRSCFAAEQAHAEAISELHYQGALDSYDIDTGWPV